MTDLIFKCPECAKHLVGGEQSAHKSIRCPDCQKSILVPDIAGTVGCPACQQKVCVANNVVGSNFHCPYCEKEFRVPVPQSASITPLPTAAPRIPMAAAPLSRPTAPPAFAPPAPVVATSAGTFKGSLFGRKGWCLVDCLSGAWVMIDTFPFEIGSADAVDLKIEDLLADHCTLKETRDQGLCLVKSSAQAGVIVNGG